MSYILRVFIEASENKEIFTLEIGTVNIKSHLSVVSQKKREKSKKKRG